MSVCTTDLTADLAVQIGKTPRRPPDDDVLGFGRAVARVAKAALGRARCPGQHSPNVTGRQASRHGVGRVAIRGEWVGAGQALTP